jgi:hypothetical protein
MALIMMKSPPAQMNWVSHQSTPLARGAVILIHNMEEYVNCADERGGFVHNDFKASQILSSGVAQPIIQPNLCGKTHGIAKPGELILFVRPWEPGEKI